MAALKLFSYRKRVAEGNVPDVYVYDELPEQLRVQVVHIWKDAIGPFRELRRYESEPLANPVWEEIHNSVAREHGLFGLADHGNPFERCVEYLLGHSSVDDKLDLIEFSFFFIDRVIRQRQRHDGSDGAKMADMAIAELNERFRRAGVGYQFESGKILRVDSELIHTEVVVPALRYLNRRGFEGPREEFLAAHAHYRSGQTKEAVTLANNAFESTLKVICGQRRWRYPPGARAAELLKVVRNKGLLPRYLDNSFDQLAATLKSGLPKVRGEEGAHGQGTTPRKTPDHVAAYALHLAAAKIQFLAEAQAAE
ncbi:MAG: hypothetical protein F4112_10170 [Holophagales bacterium]|nr:hypothetical protein [Holophagales bacterium]MYD23841.1 hypothetical protein [Holophagales bacterium]MYI33326.1 hypothetical protein [Holophagales bacterium]